MSSLMSASLIKRACASVFTAMNSTPRRPVSIMRFTAFTPAPPTPTTLITAMKLWPGLVIGGDTSRQVSARRPPTCSTADYSLNSRAVAGRGQDWCSGDAHVDGRDTACRDLLEYDLERLDFLA